MKNPTNLKYSGITQTLFRGETLRALLLQAWAFWFAGTLALYAAFGMTLGALAVFGAFLFEFLGARKRETVVRPKAIQAAAAV